MMKQETLEYLRWNRQRQNPVAWAMTEQGFAFYLNYQRLPPRMNGNGNGGVQ